MVAPFAAANAVARRLRFVAHRITKRPPLFTPGLRAYYTQSVREPGLPQSPVENAVADAMAWFARDICSGVYFAARTDS